MLYFSWINWLRSTQSRTLARQPIRGRRAVAHRRQPRCRLALEELESRTVPSTFDVINTGDNAGVNPLPGAGTGTLRQAIIDANANGGGTIDFNISGSGVQTIQLTSALPAITAPVTLDATSQPGFAGTPLIDIDATNAGNGLTLAASNSIVQGLVISNAAGTALVISGGSDDLISNVDASWTGAGQVGQGVAEVNGCLGNTISNVNVANRINGMNISDDNLVKLSDNDYSNTVNGVSLSNMSGLILNGSIGTGLDTSANPFGLEWCQQRADREHGPVLPGRHRSDLLRRDQCERF